MGRHFQNVCSTRNEKNFTHCYQIQTKQWTWMNFISSWKTFLCLGSFFCFIETLSRFNSCSTLIIIGFSEWLRKLFFSFEVERRRKSNNNKSSGSGSNKWSFYFQHCCDNETQNIKKQLWLFIRIKNRCRWTEMRKHSANDLNN